MESLDRDQTESDNKRSGAARFIGNVLRVGRPSRADKREWKQQREERRRAISQYYRENPEELEAVVSSVLANHSSIED
jgi:hypothetical protein